MYSLPQILFLVLVETKEPKEVATEINGLLLELPSVDVSAAWLGPVICWIASETDFLTKGSESGWCCVPGKQTGHA